ncbi:hypothetical protein [Sphingobacterium wenxiniae]|uniref:Uncharacterized protein n=1 Tax=Sphingobacterium wenxiniae TaxID=683125 RepID=A0A1I6P4L8_9SPHI|nr:hypothetical protein [Sphingobacterium wenxiniae]SFS35112.1 hypothetical protein SAMN05660206_101278 [Sphingobacterium wenxiniae]
MNGILQAFVKPKLFDVGLQWFGVLAKEFDVLAKEFGVLAKEFGVLAKEFGELAKEFGELAKEFGVLAKEFGALAKEFGVLAKEFVASTKEFVVFSEALSPKVCKFFYFCWILSSNLILSQLWSFLVSGLYSIFGNRDMRCQQAQKEKNKAK